MKPKLLVGLAALTAVAVIAAVGVTVMRGSSTPSAAVGERLFPDLAGRVGDIQAIVVARQDTAFRVARAGENWVVPDKANYPAAFDRVRQFIVNLGELRKLEAKTSTPSLYPSLEVEDPSAPDSKSTRIALQDASGREIAALIVGKQRFGRGGTSGDGVYVRKPDEPQAWLVQGRLTVDREAVAWLDRMILDVRRERVRQVTVTTQGTPLVVARARPDDADFVIGNLPADRKPKSSYDVNAVAGALENLELDDVRPLSEVRFDENGPRTEAVTFDGLWVTVSFAEQDGATWARLGVKFEPPPEPIQPTDGKETKLKAFDEVRAEAEAITTRVGGWAYRLPTYKLEQLRRKLDDLVEEKKAS